MDRAAHQPLIEYSADDSQQLIRSDRSQKAPD